MPPRRAAGAARGGEAALVLDDEDLEDWQWHDPDELTLRRKSRLRYLIAFVVLILYATLITRTRTTGSLGNLDSFVQQGEFLDELSPDEEKLIERVVTNKETPGFAGAMVFEDIARIIAVGQRFCIQEEGYNDHHTFSHVCAMEVEKLAPSKRMTLRSPFDVQANTSAGNGWGELGFWDLVSRGEFLKAIGARSWPYTIPPTRPAGARCDKPFIQEHVVEGDSPFAVPWGKGPPGLAIRQDFDEPYALGFQPGLYDYLDRSELIAELPSLAKLPDLDDKARTALNRSLTLQATGDVAKGLPIGEAFGFPPGTKREQVGEAASIKHVQGSSPGQAQANANLLALAGGANATAGGGANTTLNGSAGSRGGPAAVDWGGKQALVVDALGVSRSEAGGALSSTRARPSSVLEEAAASDAGAQAVAALESSVHALESLAGTGPARLAAVRALERLAEGGEPGAGRPEGRERAAGRLPPLRGERAHNARWRRKREPSSALVELRGGAAVPTVKTSLTDLLKPECFTLQPKEAIAHQQWRAKGKEGPEPAAPYTFKKTCRNHHWGYLALCQPAELSVVFRLYLTNKRGTIAKHTVEGREVLVYEDYQGVKISRVKIAMNFKSVGVMNGQDGVYQAELRTNSFVAVGEFGWSEFILGVAFFICIFTPTFQPIGAFCTLMELLKLPWTRRDVETREQAVALLLDILDPYEYDRMYTTAYAMFIRVLLIWLIVLAILVSLINFFCSSYIFPDVVLTKNSDYCQLHGFTGAAYFWQCPHMFESTGSLVGSGFWLSLLHPYVIEYHEGVVVVLFLFCLNIFTDYKSTAWVGSTFYKSVAKMNTFLPIFIVCLLGFAFLFQVRFGARFIQFSTFENAIMTLSLFTFSVPGDSVVEGADADAPLFDREAYVLQLSLLIYGIFVVMLVLNFFTTVVLDSYEQAKNERYEPVLSQNVRSLGQFDWLFPQLFEERMARTSAVLERKRTEALAEAEAEAEAEADPAGPA